MVSVRATVGAVCAVAGLLAGCGTYSGPTMTMLANEVERTGGMGFLLPSELPPGYRFIGPWTFVTDGNGAVLRSGIFGAAPLSAGPVVEWCLELDDARRGCAADPADARVLRQDGDVYVTVRFIDTAQVPESDDAFWRGVGIADAAAVAWLPD